MIYLHFAIKTELFEFARKNPKPFWSLLSPPILLVDPDFSMIAPPQSPFSWFQSCKIYHFTWSNRTFWWPCRWPPWRCLRFFEDSRSVLCVVELCEHGDLSSVLDKPSGEDSGTDVAAMNGYYSHPPTLWSTNVAIENPHF